MLSKIRIVLVGTTHPGNIGGVARAMKNMKLLRLYLVNPKIFPSADATSRAAGADDILCRAILCDSLEEAIADCKIVIGTTARSRSISAPVLNARECAELVVQKYPESEVALVFGREHSGLTNIELDLCKYCLTIPSNPEFSSLNLAAAVQLVSYEFFTAVESQPTITEVEPDLLATSQQLESFYQHLSDVLAAVGFIHPAKSGSIMRRIRRLFNRVNLESKEIDILRGILSAIQGRKKRSDSSDTRENSN